MKSHGQQSVLPRHTRFTPIALCVLSFAIGGCSSSEFPLAPISGVVTLDGQPLEGARLTFQPRSSPDAIMAGPPSYGFTDAKGRYQLETHHGDRGAVVANHRVSISTELKEAEKGGTNELIILAEERLPDRYNNKTILVYEVTNTGSDECNFELESENSETVRPKR